MRVRLQVDLDVEVLERVFLLRDNYWLFAARVRGPRAVYTAQQHVYDGVFAEVFHRSVESVVFQALEPTIDQIVEALQHQHIDADLRGKRP